MKGIEKISIIGDQDVQTRLGGLFSAAGLDIKADEDFHEEMGGTDFVFECLAVDKETRKQAWHRWQGFIRPDAVMATATPGITIELAGLTAKPEKVIGLDFIFNPQDERKVFVQLMKGPGTSDKTTELCMGLMERIGVSAIIVEDTPGLVLDRPLACVINEAAIMYSTGIASLEDIDRIPKLCLNWPMGPFEFADNIGMDKVLATLEALQAHYGPRFQPCDLLREMVAMNRLGVKAGRGFYSYSRSEEG
ncbi:MAG: 3-hydroxybutyryl-CoA dehydrogenase [Dehalococcoidia bacterium]|nr:3-hydroxybutyryl-CoA dehydrogenase [Dehalococcoidia bacterium]